MVLPAASALRPPCFPVALTKNRVCQLRNSFLINSRKQRVSVTCCAKFPSMEHFNEPTTNLIVFFNYTKEKLWKFIPVSVKSFPWKKAESVALHESLILGKETLKWSFLAWFAVSWLSDILYSISRNKELMIPFGLFVGNMMTRYIDQIYQEFVHDDHKDGSINWRFLGISCFLVLVKVMSTYFSGGKDFLLHVANGGLMHVLWSWRNLPKLDDEKSVEDGVSTPQES